MLHWPPVTPIFAGCSASRRASSAAFPLTAAATIWPSRLRPLDVRLERAPALEAVLPGDVELRLMQLGGGIAGAQLREPLLRGLLQPFDIGARRESLGHETPSFSSARCPQPTGKKEDVEAHRSDRRVQPFTRTVGRLLGHGGIIGGRPVKSNPPGGAASPPPQVARGRAPSDGPRKLKEQRRFGWQSYAH